MLMLSEECRTTISNSSHIGIHQLSRLSRFPHLPACPTSCCSRTCVLPLHIFEPRYREMVADALDGDRIIGMVLLRPGWEGDYEGRPPIYTSVAPG